MDTKFLDALRKKGDISHFIMEISDNKKTILLECVYRGEIISITADSFEKALNILEHQINLQVNDETPIKLTEMMAMPKRPNGLVRVK